MSSAKTHSRAVEDGWICHWLVLGPFEALITDRPALVTPDRMPGLLHWGGEQNPDGWPEVGRTVPSQHREWHLLSSAGPTCSLEKPHDGSWPRWFYLAAYLRAYEQIRATLELSCNGCFMLRSDGSPILWHQGWPRNIDMPAHTGELVLSEGCHLLLLKLVTHGRRPAFALRLKDQEGNPLTGKHPVALRTAPLQSMTLDLPARGKKLSAQSDMPSLCVAAKSLEKSQSLSRREKPWADSVPACRFRSPDGYRARWQTSVSLSYTNEELRILCECENHRQSIVREPMPWLSDHVLLLLDPDHSHTRSRAVLINLHGETWTRCIPGDRLETRIETRDHGWAGLLRIPFKALGKSCAPDRGERWGFNAVRVCPDASDGLTFWFNGNHHTPTHRETLTAESETDTPWWPDRPESLGHLEFGENDLTVKKTAIKRAETGRFQLRAAINNENGKARAFLRYSITGTADTWPAPVRSESTLDSGEKSWLLPVGARSSTTVPLSPLPPGHYCIEIRMEVPGRDFGQTVTIPFTSPRELRDKTGGKTRARPGGGTTDGTDRARAWTFYLAEEPPHELLLRVHGRWDEDVPVLHWNGHPLQPEHICAADSEHRVLQAAVPVSAMCEGENELVMKSARHDLEDLPAVDEVRLRLCEAGNRNVTEGTRVYHFDPAGSSCARGTRKLVSTSPRGVPHENCEVTELESGRTMSFPVLLDRPGGTLDVSHSDFWLQVAFILPEDSASAPPPLRLRMNERHLETTATEKMPCFLEHNPATRCTIQARVPEDALRNGINTLELRCDNLRAGPAWLHELILKEQRWDDPQVAKMPRSVSVRQRWAAELRTDRPHTLRRISLPSHVKPAFDCPLEIAPGTTSLTFESLNPAPPLEAELDFDEVTVRFTIPPVQPRPSLLQSTSAGDLPAFTLTDGSIEMQLAAMRGRTRSQGCPRFRVRTDRLTVPHAPDSRASSFERLLEASLFLAGAETSQDIPDGFPAVRRRDGLPAAEIALIDTAGDPDAPCQNGRPDPPLQTVASALLPGTHFPGPAGPLFPEDPTGHFNGTPWGKFDILAGRDVTAQTHAYRFLVPAQTALDPELLERLQTVVENGSSIVLTPAHSAALKTFGIDPGAPASARRVRLHGIGKLPEETVLVRAARYSVLNSDPDEVLGSCEPEGHALVGKWRRGRGSVFVICVNPLHGPAEEKLFGQCLERLQQFQPPPVHCDHDLVNLSVFPEEPEFYSAESTAGRQNGLPPLRIYAVHCGWWQPAPERVECILTIRDREMPLQWPAHSVQAVYATTQAGVAPQDPYCYVESIGRRESGCEIQVRGNGTHDIIVLPLSGRIAAARCHGKELTTRPVNAGSPAVRVTLEASGLTRFQIITE